MRQGSAPNFCPPVEEGVTLEFVDERGDAVTLEFLGLVLHGERRYGFFFPVSEDEPAGSSGEVVLLEVTELDEDGQPSAFELVEDEGVASEVYAARLPARASRRPSGRDAACAAPSGAGRRRFGAGRTCSPDVSARTGPNRPPASPARTGRWLQGT